MTYPTEQADLIQDEGKPDMPQPAAQVVNPVSLKLEDIYRNIENEPLLDRIKKSEIRLEGLLGLDSIEIEMDELKDGKQETGIHIVDSAQRRAENEKLLKELLDCFNELLKTPYGSLGYLVKSDSESISKLYGVDSDEDYYSRLDGSVIRVSSKTLEKMFVAGGGKRWIGERGLMLHNPAETLSSMKIADHVIHEIIYAIHEKLEELQS